MLIDSKRERVTIKDLQKPKIVKKLDSTSNPKSYYNKVKKQNKNNFVNALGMEDVRDLCLLQIKGHNQFSKEVEELKDLPVKLIDMQALHRNEKTHENEGDHELVVNPDEAFNLNTNNVRKQMSFSPKKNDEASENTAPRGSVVDRRSVINRRGTIRDS